MKSLLREFEDAFNPEKTSPKVSIHPLVDKILLMVKPSEMNEFLDGLKSITRFNFDAKFYSILDDILSGSNTELKNYAITYLRQSNDLVYFLSHYPAEVGQLVAKDEVRTLWYSKLKSCRERFSIVAKLISVGLLDVLKSSKMNPEFTRRNAKDCGKNHYDFFRGFAYTLPINTCTVEMMLDIFNQTDYPTVWCEIYNKMIDDNEDRGKEFQKIKDDNGFVVPLCLKYSDISSLNTKI